MGDQMAKGEDMEKKAEKKINGWGLFGSKYEDAGDLYDKAANCYKLAKSCMFSFSASFHRAPCILFLSRSSYLP